MKNKPLILIVSWPYCSLQSSRYPDNDLTEDCRKDMKLLISMA